MEPKKNHLSILQKKTIYQEKLADVLEFEKLVSRNTKITKISQTNA